MCVGVGRVCVGGRLGVGSVRVFVWGVWGAGVCGWGLDACVSCVCGGGYGGVWCTESHNLEGLQGPTRIARSTALAGPQC